MPSLWRRRERFWSVFMVAGEGMGGCYLIDWIREGSKRLVVLLNCCIVRTSSK